MKNLGKFLALGAVVAFAHACNNAPEETVETTDAEEVQEVETETSATFTVDTSGNEISWIGFKTYADGKHNGHIQLQEGRVTVEGDEVVGGRFVIDMNSISNEDLDDTEKRTKLIGHLKSEDFFHVEQYPTATFEITQVMQAPDSLKVEANRLIKGNLSMRGNTKNITVPAQVDVDDNEVNVTTPEFVINRTEWKVMYGSDKLGSVAQDQLIDNNIKLELDFTAKRQAS